MFYLVDLFPIFKAINSISVNTLARPHVVHYVIVYSIESWWCLDKKWVKKREERMVFLFLTEDGVCEDDLGFDAAT